MFVFWKKGPSLPSEEIRREEAAVEQVMKHLGKTMKANDSPFKDKYTATILSSFVSNTQQVVKNLNTTEKQQLSARLCWLCMRFDMLPQEEKSFAVNAMKIVGSWYQIWFERWEQYVIAAWKRKKMRDTYEILEIIDWLFSQHKEKLQFSTRADLQYKLSILYELYDGADDKKPFDEVFERIKLNWVNLANNIALIPQQVKDEIEERRKKTREIKIAQEQEQNIHLKGDWLFPKIWQMMGLIREEIAWRVANQVSDWHADLIVRAEGIMRRREENIVAKADRRNRRQVFFAPKKVLLDGAANNLSSQAEWRWWSVTITNQGEYTQNNNPNNYPTLDAAIKDAQNLYSMNYERIVWLEKYLRSQWITTIKQSWWAKTKYPTPNSLAQIKENQQKWEKIVFVAISWNTLVINVK